MRKLPILFIALLVASPLMADETITLTATTKQTWIAWRANVTGPIFGATQTDDVPPAVMTDIVDTLVNDLGLNGFRLAFNQAWMNGLSGIEPTNDNADPFDMDTGVFFPQFAAPFTNEGGTELFDIPRTMNEFVVPVRNAVLSNGETFSLYISTVGDYAEFQSHWHSDTDEHAEYIEAGVLWIETNWSFVPDYWAIVNEPDPSAWHVSDPSEIGLVAEAADVRFSTRGWNTKIQFPEVLQSNDGGGQNMTNSCGHASLPDCIAAIGLVSFHGYDYNSFDVIQDMTGRTFYRDKAATWGVPTAMTEICCKTGWDGSYTHGLELARDIFWNMTEADVSVWEQLDIMGPCGATGCPSAGSGYIALEPVDLDEIFLMPNYYAIRQFSRWVRPGMIRVDTSCVGCTAEPSKGATAKVVVFKKPDAAPDNLHVIVAINDRAVSTVMTFSNFPAGLYEYEGIYTAICPNTSGTRERCAPDTGKMTVGETDWVFEMPAEAIYTFNQIYVSDKYGGFETIDAPGGATGVWRVWKFGDRWMVVTPDGHPTWSIGVFAVTPTANAVAKYGDQDLTWGPQQIRRIRWWGFNTTLSHTLSWATPYQTNDQWPGDETQPEKMAHIFLINTTNESWRNISSHGTQASKELFNRNDATGQGVDTTYYGGDTNPTPDPYDPYLQEWLENRILVADIQTILNHPWVIGVASAESDFVFGFGAGSSDDFATIPPGHNNPHLGAIVLITSPTQTGNTEWSVTYTDTEVYAKSAFKVFMEARYATIGDLNTAWSSNYSTFGNSPSGWGQDNTAGTLNPFGLLDENGSSPWTPTSYITLSGITATMKTDLDDYLFDHADKLFDILDTTIRAQFPNIMHFGPNVLGSWVTPPRQQILQAAGSYLDMGLTSLGTPNADDQARLDFWALYFGDKPIASWLGIVADGDSAVNLPNPDTQFPEASQEARGTRYDELMNIYLDSTLTVGGAKPYVGVRWWAHVDSTGEDTNWGFVTPTDNAYNGTDAVIAAGTDQWGFTTGGEAADYGDFLNAAQLTNGQILEALFLEMLLVTTPSARISGTVTVRQKVVIQ